MRLIEGTPKVKPKEKHIAPKLSEVKEVKGKNTEMLKENCHEVTS